MKANGVMTMGRINGPHHILAASRHNKRTMYANGTKGSDIDATRSHLNYSLAGPESPDEVRALWEKLRADVGISGPGRKNQVSAIEIVFSLRADTKIDLRSYFTDCTRWAMKRFGGVCNILSSDVHLDQPNPHCHVLMLPLIDGKMKGSDLYWGESRGKSELHADLHADVGSRYGLRKPSKNLSGAAKEAAARRAWERLMAMADDAQRWASIINAIQGAIGLDPEPFEAELGTTPPVQPAKTLKEIALSTGAGPKTEAGQASRDARLERTTTLNGRNPIGFGAMPEETLSCVEIHKFTPSYSSSSDHPPPGEADPTADARETPEAHPRHPPQEADRTASPAPPEYTRTRDAELDPANFHYDTGEWVRPQVQTRSGKAEANAWALVAPRWARSEAEAATADAS